MVGVVFYGLDGGGILWGFFGVLWLIGLMCGIGGIFFVVLRLIVLVV